MSALEALAGLGHLIELISLRDHSHFSPRSLIKGFVKMFTVVVLAADDPGALHDQSAGGNRQPLRLEVHHHDSS